MTPILLVVGSFIVCLVIIWLAIVALESKSCPQCHAWFGKQEEGNKLLRTWFTKQEVWRNKRRQSMTTMHAEYLGNFRCKRCGHTWESTYVMENSNESV